MNKAEIQKQVWDFIHAFRDDLVAEFEKEIDFVIVYGSAVRGEFVPGKSDVDITVQIFKEKDKVRLEKRANELFWKVAAKYPELRFEEAVRKPKGGKRVAADFLYVPIFVFVRGEIDWKNGKLHSEDFLVNLGKNLLVPERSVFLKFKKEGEVVYGRDIRKEIDVKLTLWDRLRVNTSSLLLVLAANLVVWIRPSLGQGLTTKALLYEVDGLLTMLDAYERMSREEKIEKNQELLLKEFTERLSKILKIELDHQKGILKAKDFQLFQKAYGVKTGKIRLSFFEKLLYSWRALWLILRVNTRAIFVLLLR